uniref:Putative GTP-binding protein At5g64813 isoform X3 n=1 Tax=Rhizophora mucronata TaxID=61149 RepID=A0A2P2JTP3_RHIMU
MGATPASPPIGELHQQDFHCFLSYHLLQQHRLCYQLLYKGQEDHQDHQNPEELKMSQLQQSRMPIFASLFWSFAGRDHEQI